MTGVDEAWARLTPAECVANGIVFVIGYLTADTTGKRLTPAEVAAYHAAIVAVVLVYEDAAGAFTGGAAVGAAHAARAVAQAREDGFPAGKCLYTAVDRDTTGNPGVIDPYLRAYTAGVHAGGYRSGVYGGLATIRRALDLGLVDLGWQAFAWSGTPTVWDPRAAIRQTRNGVIIAGKDVDVDVPMVADYGAWMPGTGGTDMTPEESIWLRRTHQRVYALSAQLAQMDLAGGEGTEATPGGTLASRLDGLKTAIAGLGGAPTQDQVTAAVTAALTNPTVLAGLGAAISSAVATAEEIAAVRADVASLRQALATGATAQHNALA